MVIDLPIWAWLLLITGIAGLSGSMGFMACSCFQVERDKPPEDEE